MAKFNYQLITNVQVEVTLEGLKKNHPDIVQRLIEKGYGNLLNLKTILRIL